MCIRDRRDISKTQAGFLDTLARFDLKIQYLKGELNIPADEPSRRPDYKQTVDNYALQERIVALEQQLEKLKEEKNKDKKENRAKVRATLRVSHLSLHDWLSRIEKAYETDPEYMNREESKQFTHMDNMGFSLWYHHTLDDDLPPCICIPNDKQLREQILKEFHEPPTIGHLSGEAMSTALRRAYFWKGMLKEATTFARSCPTCQPHIHDKRSKAGFMAPQEAPIRPWSSIALDFFGPLATHGSKEKDSVNMILVAVCRLTKMAHFIPCKETATAQEIADLVVNHVIKLHGLPDDFRSDRDKIFTSKFWEHIWKRMGTTLSLSTAYHHQTAGQAERANQELRRYMAIYCKSHADWQEHLAMAEFSFNARVNRSLGLTPFEMNYGFTPKMPAQFLMPPPPPREATQAEKKAWKSGEQWLTDLDKMWTQANAQLDKSHEQHAKYYNKKRRNERETFAVGKYVYLRSLDLPNRETIAKETDKNPDDLTKRKFLPVFIGPFKILEVCGHGRLNRRLELSKSLLERLKSDTFHIEKLKPAHPRNGPFSIMDPIPIPMTTQGEFFIEKIVSFRETPRKGKEFQVKWLGYNGAEGLVWLKESEMDNAQDLVKEFLQETRLRNEERVQTTTLNRRRQPTNRIRYVCFKAQ